MEVICSKDRLTPLEDPDHVLYLLRVWVLAAERLRSQHFILPHGLGPVQPNIVVVLLPLSPAPARRAAPLLHGARAEPAGQTVRPAVLERHARLELPAPVQPFLPVVRGARVEGHVDLDHTGAGLEAELDGRRPRRRVCAVGVLEDEEAPAEREGRVEEDLVGGCDGVVLVVGGLALIDEGGRRLFRVDRHGVGGHSWDRDGGVELG